MTTFDFESAESWDVSTATLLPNGNHVCEIRDATTGRSSGNFPQIELEVFNDNGSRKDWLVYGDQGGYGVRKVATLFRMAGVQLSNEDQDADGCLTQAAVERLNGKKVGVVIRDEEDRRNPGQTRPRIKGYVDPSTIDTAQAVAASAGSSSRGGSSPVADEDIPF